MVLPNMVCRTLTGKRGESYNSYNFYLTQGQWEHLISAKLSVAYPHGTSSNASSMTGFRQEMVVLLSFGNVYLRVMTSPRSTIAYDKATCANLPRPAHDPVVMQDAMKVALASTSWPTLNRPAPPTGRCLDEDGAQRVP